MTPEPLFWLDEISHEHREAVGAKAFALARLRQQGLPVPDGFVLTAGDALGPARQDALVQAYRRLGGRVAVRSSSPAEDTEAASFAGQYVTVLDVAGEPAVVAAVERCLARRDASGYARAAGALGSDRMAVLVQRFVEPRAAGVAFTRHPSQADALLVESHAGRGEAVVSGRVSPDRYVLDRATKELSSGPAHGSLAASELRELADLALIAERTFACPQDVEWAIGSEGAVLLQSRPITVAVDEPTDAGVRLLTRANVGEVLPGAVTPLTWTTVGDFLEQAFRGVARQAGLLPPGSAPFLVLYRSRLYLNLTRCVEVALRMPGVSPADAEMLILGDGGSRGARLAVAPRRASWAGSLLRLAQVAVGLEARIAGARQALAGLAGREARGGDLADLSAPFAAFQAAGLRIADAHVAVSGASGVRLALLARLLAAGEPAATIDRVSRLVSGLDGVASTAPTLALEALAEEARRQPSSVAWLLSGTPESQAASLQAGTAPAELAQRLTAFLRAFGHRAVSEGELATASWAEDPRPVLLALRAHLPSLRPAGFGHRAAAELRQADEAALLSRLWPARRALVAWALGAAREWIVRREETKSLAVALVDRGRQLARAAGRQLREGGALNREDDVFFLRAEELRAALTGTAPPAAVLLRRRRQLARESALPAPRDVDLAGEATASPATQELQGIGVSGGVGAGPARVLGAEEAPDLRPGEVLVAPVLDAAYGPLLAAAAGAVAEIGGLLSHGAVVARELGVPCVVDVRDATRRLKTGDVVLVDGGTGRVSVLPEGGRASLPDAGLPSAPEDDEPFHALEPDPLARESVYFNARDEATGIGLVASLGVRPRQRGEAVLVLSLPDGRVLSGLELSVPRPASRGLSVGASTLGWLPARLGFDGRLAAFEASAFPPGPIPLFTAPRTVAVSLDLEFVPTTPAFDLAAGLAPEVKLALRPLGSHHVEQSGRWRGQLSVDGLCIRFDGAGGRDHSWGLRDWEAADHWRLFTLRLAPELAVHALVVSVRGRLVEGGFLWRDGRALRITRVRYATERQRDRLIRFDLEVSATEGAPLLVRGTVLETLRIPVQLARNPLRHLQGRPYRMILQENFTRYEAQGHVGYGMAEFTQR